MSYLPAEHVASLQQVDTSGYWWYAVRQGWIGEAVALARSSFDEVRMVDFGCGPGGLLKSLTADHAFSRALGIDGDPQVLEVARRRGLDVLEIDVQSDFALPFAPNLWVCADVLEHLLEDAAVLRRLRAAGAPGSLLAITVPAHQWLFSDWDTRNGHHRRYDRRGLSTLLESCGWEPIRLRYFFSFLVPAVYWTRILRPRPSSLEFPAVPGWLNAALTLSGRIERAFPIAPCGTSLFALARAKP